MHLTQVLCGSQARAAWPMSLKSAASVQVPVLRFRLTPTGILAGMARLSRGFPSTVCPLGWAVNCAALPQARARAQSRSPLTLSCFSASDTRLELGIPTVSAIQPFFSARLCCGACARRRSLGGVILPEPPTLLRYAALAAAAQRTSSRCGSVDPASQPASPHTQ